MPSTYVKKNGVAQRLAGIPQGWNVVNTFNVASTAWVANPDSTTSTDYPYVATISTTYFSNDSQPIWQMNGVGSLPTETEREAINMILEAVFTSTGITLYATDQPAVNLVLETGGFATSYASGTTSAADVTYSNTTSGLVATNVQAAIDEVAGSYVEVTADGTKTYGTLLNELAAAADFSKVTAKSCYQQVDPTNPAAWSCYHLDFANAVASSDGRAVYMRPRIGSNVVTVNAVDIRSTGSSATTINGTSTSTQTSDILTSGTKLRLVY